MLDGKYILFAWSRFYPKGGFNDNCGLFINPSYAYDFFKNSSHCEFFEYYQIINVETLTIESEGRRDGRRA